MAVAGGATAAYRCTLVGGKLQQVPTSTLRSECLKPEAALVALLSGEAAIVAGTDMFALRGLWEAQK